jgi:hypothetical protein
VSQTNDLRRRPGQRGLLHLLGGDGVRHLGDDDEVAVRIGNRPVAMTPELVGRLLDDARAGIPGVRKEAIDVLIVADRGVKREAPAERSLVMLLAGFSWPNMIETSPRLTEAWIRAPVSSGRVTSVSKPRTSV